MSENTNTITFGDNTGGPDPRCPYCGRPVLSIYVQGNEGRYHPECTRPPMDHAPRPAPYLPQLPTDRPWWVPPDYPYKVTCEGVEVRK